MCFSRRTHVAGVNLLSMSLLGSKLNGWVSEVFVREANAAMPQKISHLQQGAPSIFDNELFLALVGSCTAS